MTGNGSPEGVRHLLGLLTVRGVGGKERKVVDLWCCGVDVKCGKELTHETRL